MSSWFSYGDTPSTTEEERQQASSLVANDDMQNMAAQPSTRQAAAVVEQGSIFHRISSGGSIFDQLTSGVSDMFIDSSSRPGSNTSKRGGRDINNNSHESTQRTVLAARRNSDQAEAAAKQMEQDMKWWKTSSANDTGEEDTPIIISEDPDLLALASEEHFGDSTNHRISFDVVKKFQTQSTTSQVKVQSRVVPLPKSNQRKLDKVQEIVQWRERTIASGKLLTSELIVPDDQLSMAFEMLEPLMEWWRIKGKEFAVKNRHLTVNKSDECDRKLKETYQWLSTNLQNKECASGSDTPNWLRGKNSERQGDGSSPFVGAGNLFGLPFGRGGLTLPEQRAKEMEEALSWLRRNELNYDDPDRDDASARTMNKINSMVPGAMDKDPVEVAATMEAALVWLRASDDASTTFHLDDGSVGSSKNIPGPRLGTPEEARARAMENALQALRANDASKNFVDDPSFKSSGSKLDAIPEARRSDAPDWLRKTDATYKSSRDDQSLNPSKVPKCSLVPLTPEEARTNDMAIALEWLRSHETSADVTMDSTAVPSFASGLDQKVNYATSGVDCFQGCGSRRTGFDDYSTASGKQSRGALSAEEQRAILMADDLNRLRDISAGIAGRNDSFGDIPAWTSHPGGQVGSTVDLLRSNNLDIDTVDVPPRKAAVRNLEEVPSGNSAGIAGTDDSISDVPTWMRHPGDQITSAIDFLRSNKININALDDLQVALSPDDRARVMEHALNRLRNNNPDINSADGDYPSIDYVGMPRGQPSPGDFLTIQSQSPLKQKKELEELLEWLLKNNPHMDLIDYKTIAVFSSLAGVPIPQGRLTAEEKGKVSNDSLNWLRSNKFNPSDLSHATIAALANLAGVSLPEGRPDDQIKAVEDALLWLGSNYPDFENIDTATLGTMAHLAGITIPNGELLPEQKKKSAEQALDWLRTCNVSPDDVVFDDTTLTSVADILMLSRKGVPLDKRENVAEKEMSWVRNSHPYLNGVDDPATDLLNNFGDVDLFNNFAGIPRSAQAKAKPRKPSSEDKYPPEWSWHRNMPGPSGVLEPIVNPDVTDGSAPWASQPDEESDDGRGPTPMAIPEDLYSEESPKESKQKPKGVVIPVWLMLTLAVMVSVIGTASIPKQGATEIGVPPPILYDLTAPVRGSWPVLPDLAVVPGLPCAQDSTCGFVMEAINPVLPVRTRPLVDIEGTCQHWAREWLRTSRDIMEFKPERIHQRFAMAILYCEFNGDNWLEGDFWLSDLHECDWYTLVGVDPCGRREQYQIIRSYGQQMRGTLPPELSMLSTLWEVTLSDNLIEGTIPSEYYKLSKLETLGLAFNLFKGPIPDFVWEFEDMVYMDLAYNFFTGTIPDTVHLTEPNLRVLFLENNDLASTIPNTFGQLDWKRLHLDGNKFTGPVPSDINAPRIEEIMLHNNQLTGAFPAASFATEFAGKHSKLRVVTLNNNEMSGDVNGMCPLISDGRLQRFDVDLDKMICNCCSSGD
jgi:hypothetical protein